MPRPGAPSSGPQKRQCRPFFACHTEFEYVTGAKNTTESGPSFRTKREGGTRLHPQIKAGFLSPALPAIRCRGRAVGSITTVNWGGVRFLGGPSGGPSVRELLPTGSGPYPYSPVCKSGGVERTSAHAPTRSQSQKSRSQNFFCRNGGDHRTTLLSSL